MKRYGIYILDFDGTVFDTLDSLVEIYNAGFRYLGYEVGREEVSVYMHHSLEEVVSMCHIPIEKAYKWGTLIGEALKVDAGINEIKPFHDTAAFIKALKDDGHPMSIVTGNTKDHVQRVLELNGLGGYFDGIYSGVDYKSKPAPDVLLAAMANYPSAKKEDFVYIGDSLQDVECAKNAGIDGVLLDRNGEHPEFEGAKIQSLLDVLD